MLLATQDESKGISSVEMEFLRANAPRQSVDKWGDPLPLSAVDQDRLDRTFALLVSPLERGRALLVSGELIPQDVSALRMTNPDVLLALQQHAEMEMASNGPPYAAWAEASLSYLFERPAAVALAAPDQPAPGKGGGKQPGPGALPTPVDRLDPAVRQQSKGQ